MKNVICLYVVSKGNSNTAAVVLYPEDGVSKIQKAQMTSANSPNIRVIGVNSDFDFCQTTIKTIFNDSSFNKRLTDSYNVQLSAANSLNWGRFLPQVVYHASAYLDLVKTGVISMGEMADLCVPTGNFGNILAAYYTKVCCGGQASDFSADQNYNKIATGSPRTYFLRNRSTITWVSNSPFYICVLSDLAFEWKRGWS